MQRGRVFRRSSVADPPVAVEASGSTIRDSAGREYLDAAGGAIVVNVGHGRHEIARVMAEQAGRLAYAHGSAFTTEPLEAYARAVAPHLPVDDPAIYPVSGGSEAIETALKLARAYHIARGEPDRWIVYARWGSYHGNTLGALDLSGRKPLRRPYEGWLGRFRHVSAAYPYRADLPGANALGSAEALAAELDAAFSAAEPRSVAAFVAEPIVGATLAAVEPPDGYWPAIAEVCARHGVLLIADEVMTGFGRTGTLVRARPLERPAGHARRGEGRDVGLLAVRLRRRLGRGLRDDHRVRRRASSTASPTRTRRSPPPSRPRSSPSSSANRSSRRARPRASVCSSSRAAAFGDHPAVGEIRGRGLHGRHRARRRPRDPRARSRAPPA